MYTYRIVLTHSPTYSVRFGCWLYNLARIYFHECMHTMVEEFRIIVGHPFAHDTEVPSVLSGSEVSGTVLVKLDEPERCKSLKICLKGVGYVTWSSAQQWSLEDRDIVTYREREWYINWTLALWDESQSPYPDHVLPAGEYHFPFKFTLPITLPSSYVGSVDAVGSFYEGSRGEIFYELKAIIDTGLFSLVSEKIPLQVTETIDISVSELARPLRFNKQKNFCLSCASGLINATVEVPRTGYCVGEEIPFRVTVENGSNRRIECVAQLQQHTLFSVHNHQRHSPPVFHATLRSSAIEAHTTNTWVPNDGVLTVPSNTPITIDTKIIKRYFQLTVTVVIPNAKNLVVSIPITIGNVLRCQGTQPVIHTAHAHSLASPEASVISEQTCVEPPSYASTLATPVSGAPVQATNVELPSYEDAVSTMY